MSSSTTTHEIKTLLQSFNPLIAIETVEEDRVETIIENLAHELGKTFFDWSIVRGLRRNGARAAFHGTNQPITALQYIGGLTVDAVYLLRDFNPYLENNEVRRQFRELCQRLSQSRSSIVVTGSQLDLPEELMQWSAHYCLNLPDSDERKDALRSILGSLREQQPFRIELGPDDLEDLVRSLGGLTLKQIRQVISHAIFEDGRLSQEDIQRILERKGETLKKQGLLEFYPSEGNRYEIGGFQSLRNWLVRARLGFSRKARELNLTPPKGILLVGVQGCGKSLAAKFVAGEWRLPLLKLEAGRLYDKFVGESEKNFRRAVAQAEAMSPNVLWIDEIEKAFSTSGSSSSDGGLSYRLLGAMLTWMQEKKEGIFLVATANDVSALPPEFLRKGRFDEIFFVDLPVASERREIMRIHLSLRKQQPDMFDLDQLVQATEGFSGAEIEQVIISALYRALYQSTKLDTPLILKEISSTVPLSKSRHEEIQNLRDWARNRFVSVR